MIPPSRGEGRAPSGCSFMIVPFQRNKGGFPQTCSIFWSKLPFGSFVRTKQNLWNTDVIMWCCFTWGEIVRAQQSIQQESDQDCTDDDDDDNVKSLATMDQKKPDMKWDTSCFSCQQHFPLFGISSNLEGVYESVFREVESPLQGLLALSGPEWSPVTETRKKKKKCLLQTFQPRPPPHPGCLGMWSRYIWRRDSLKETDTGTSTAFLLFTWLKKKEINLYNV